MKLLLVALLITLMPTKLQPTAPTIPAYAGKPAPILPKSWACPALTDAIAHIESSFGQRLSSPTGDYTGWHHMGRLAWKDVNDYRKQSGCCTYLYRDAMDYKISSYMCLNYLQLLERHFREVVHRDPSLEELLCCYNAGFHKFRLLKFNTKPFAGYVEGVKKYIK